MSHCHDCHRGITLEVASWSNDGWGLFLCPRCAVKRPTLQQSIEAREQRKRRDRLQRHWPELARMLDRSDRPAA